MRRKSRNLFANSGAISEALANDTNQSNLGPGYVVNAKANPVIIAEVEFADVAVQMGLRAVLVDALHAALEHAVKAFNGVCVNVAAHILFGAMCGEGVASKVRAYPRILASFVGHDEGGFRHMRLDDRHEGCWACAVHVEGNHPRAFRGRRSTKESTTFLWRKPRATTAPFFVPMKGFVDFNNGAFSTKHIRQSAARHRLAQSMAHEPCAFDRQAKNTCELVGTDAFLAGAHQERSLKPHVQLDVAAFKHRADRHAALLAAGVALIQARAGGIAAHQLHAVRAFAVRTDRTVRPNDAFQLRVSGGLVLEVGGIENAGHRGILSMASIYP